MEGLHKEARDLCLPVGQEDILRRDAAAQAGHSARIGRHVATASCALSTPHQPRASGCARK